MGKQTEQEPTNEAQDEENRETTTTDTAPAEEEDESSESEDKRFSQADVDKIVADRLKRERDKAKAEADKAKEEAEAKALEEQKEFQKLAEQRAAKVAELEPQAKQAERYSEALTKLLEVEKKTVPEHVMALLDKLDPVEQLEWLAANREKLQANGAEEPDKTRGVPQTPRRGDARGASEEQRRAAQTATVGMYRRKF